MDSYPMRALMYPRLCRGYPSGEATRVHPLLLRSAIPEAVRAESLRWLCCEVTSAAVAGRWSERAA